MERWGLYARRVKIISAGTRTWRRKPCNSRPWLTYYQVSDTFLSSFKRLYIYIRWKKKLGIIELEMFIYISPLFIMPLWILSSPSTEVQETWCKPVLLAPLHQSKCHTAVIPDFPAIAQTHQEGWLVAWSLAAFYAWNTRIESWDSNIYYASVCTTVLVNSSQKDETASVPIHERICTQVVYIYNFKDILLSKIS